MPSSNLPAASPGATRGLRWASPGPAPASCCPAQPFPFLLAASTSLIPASQQATSLGSASARVQLTFCLVVACTHPAPAAEQTQRVPHLHCRGLSRPGSRLTATSQVQDPACMPPGSLDRPSSSCTGACFEPTHASRCPPRGVSSCLTLSSLGRGPPHTHLLEPSSRLSWPFQAQPLPVGDLSMPSLYLTVGPLRTRPLPRCGPLRPSSCPSEASVGPAPASQWSP
uniref:DUF4705 domain-containing protein n=1 Tax=Piliocolobus tephrosceles TaxID=591936 RepID=A0A8C9H006_9PRIM